MKTLSLLVRRRARASIDREGRQDTEGDGKMDDKDAQLAILAYALTKMLEIATFGHATTPPVDETRVAVGSSRVR